jgi:hypothetical protein
MGLCYLELNAAAGAVDAGPHEVAMVVELAGVTEDPYAETVHFT